MQNNNMLIFICAIVGLGSFWLLIHRIFNLFFSLQVYKSKKKRLAQLNGIGKGKKTNEEQMEELLSVITKPAFKYGWVGKKTSKIDETNRDLKLIGWDKMMDAERKIALSIVTKIIGGIAFCLLLPLSSFMAILWGAVIMFLFDLGYKVTVKNKLEQLLVEFPDFIESVDSYLSANYTFERAVRETLPSTNHWQPILRDFLITCQHENLETGLKQMYDTVDIFEVREFLTILDLGIKEGLDMRENVARQSSHIMELQDVAFTKKIVNREVMSILVQGPLLLTILIAFGLPTFGQFMELGI